MKKLLIAFLVLSSFQLQAQKNAVYGTYGVLYSSVSYERTLLASKNEYIKWNLSGGVGILKAGRFTKDGRMANWAMSVLLGEGESFFEIKLGGGRYWESTEMGFVGKENWPIGSLGYRFEGRNVLFRLGFGFPEIFYVGGGLRF